MDPLIARERGTHGENWESLHEGYFSSPESAAPLVDALSRYVEQARPDVAVDLGGGTGVVLSLLKQRGIDESLVLKVLDLSEDQLTEARAKGLDCHRMSVADFDRGSALGDRESLLVTMRSVLHYLDNKCLADFLAHLREQVEPSEYFIHQTACFSDREDAARLNLLYGMMDTPKRYPSVDELTELLESKGWDVRETLEAPPLPLTSHDLSIRYGLPAERSGEIRGAMLKEFGEKQGVFQCEDDGFRAFLHYRVFVCGGQTPARTPVTI